jgi:hypothetical protein
MSHAITLDLVIQSSRGNERAAFQVDTLVIAGWTGRNKAAMEHHMRELEAIGIKRPASTPVFYRAAARRLTRDDEIEVSGPDSSGEVETVLFAREGQLYVGLGSDHTDRKAETQGIQLSKQLCDKPIGGTVWPFAELVDHWDQLQLRSFAINGTERRPYQDGLTAAMLPPMTLIEKLTGGGSRLPDGTAMFCGTLPAIDGIKPAEAFEMTLTDPVLGRTLTHRYRIIALPVAG